MLQSADRVSILRLLALILVLLPQQATVAGIQQDMQAMSPEMLTYRVQLLGDARRGSLVFHKSAAACVRCHLSQQTRSPLGPKLTSIADDATAQSIITSILDPSRVIRKGFETRTLVTHKGKVRSGMLVEDRDHEIVLRELTDLSRDVVISKSDVEEQSISKTSMMPAGLVDSLLSEREFYDLAKYVIAVAKGGDAIEKTLKPSPAELAVKDDTIDLDHAGIISRWNERDLKSGRRIYDNHCVNCHGAGGNNPTLVTARAFGKDRLKFGADPRSMLKTLTTGVGLMGSMQHLSPKERYQVIYFIREQFMKGRNPDYAAISDSYLKSLPTGKSSGEAMMAGERDYGPVLGSQLGRDVNHAMTFRLPSQISFNYDLHRFRSGGVWRGGFLNLSQTHHYRQRGERMPQPGGREIPGLKEYGWMFGEDWNLSTDDKPPRGPVRSHLAEFFGHYLHGDKAALHYSVYGRDILESVDATVVDGSVMLSHSLTIGPSGQDVSLCLGKRTGQGYSGFFVGESAQVVDESATLDDTVAVISVGQQSLMVAVSGQTDALTCSFSSDGRLVLTIPALDEAANIRIVRASVPVDQVSAFQAHVRSIAATPAVNLQAWTNGGPKRWPETLTVAGIQGESKNGYALDTIPVPFENPWNAWIRTSALDFFDDGRCVVTTHGGDVYIVSGIDDSLEKLTWQRFAAGLFEPFGVRVVDHQIYVTCRNGLVRLHDLDGNNEADYIETLWNDDDVSSSFHAYNFDLQTDVDGNFYFAKAGQYTNHHRPGTIMKIPATGGAAEVVAWGIRTPNGMGRLPGDRFTVSDNQGPWMPASKISLITQNAFLGNMPINAAQDAWLKERHGGTLPESFDEPMIWMPQEVDSSSGGQVWVDDQRWGPMSGRLMHSSFGKGWLYYLSLQEIDGVTQSSIVTLPHQWDAGVMRLRINPRDGQLYGTGLSGWQGPPGGKDGCLQRLRYTGDPVMMIESSRVVPGGIELNFSFPLHDQATNIDNWNVEMWDYLWSKRYGSDQFSVLNRGDKGRDTLKVAAVELSTDKRTAILRLPQLAVCDQLKISMQLRDVHGNPYFEELHSTIHRLMASETSVAK